MKILLLRAKESRLIEQADPVRGAQPRGNQRLHLVVVEAPAIPAQTIAELHVRPKCLADSSLEIFRFRTRRPYLLHLLPGFFLLSQPIIRARYFGAVPLI